jgi:hypothetical protein
MHSYAIFSAVAHNRLGPVFPCHQLPLGPCLRNHLFLRGLSLCTYRAAVLWPKPLALASSLFHYVINESDLQPALSVY